MIDISDGQNGFVQDKVTALQLQKQRLWLVSIAPKAELLIGCRVPTNQMLSFWSDADLSDSLFLEQ